MLIGGGLPIMVTDAYNLWIGEHNVEMASVFCTLRIITSMILYVLQNNILKGGYFITVGGQMIEAERRRVAWYIQYAFFSIAFLVGLVIIACFAVILASSLTRLFMIDNRLTLLHFASYAGWKALRTSFAVPGTVMGIGNILVFNSAPFFLSGGLFLIVLNIACREFPVGLESGIGKLQQIDLSIEEASRDLGAGSLRNFLRAVLPLMSSAFAASFLYTFMVGMMAISAVIFLIAPGTNLASLLILRLAETGNIGKASAMAVLLTLIVLGSLALLKLLSKKPRVEVLKGF
jgi:iron(III) transport system permease protein